MTGATVYTYEGVPIALQDKIMIYLLTSIQVLVCFFLIVVVLLQSGKAADLAGAFGGMGSQTAFGPRGSATILSKATTAAAALFMITSLTLAIVETRDASVGTGGSVLDRQKKPAAATPAPKSAVPAMPHVSTGMGTKTVPVSPAQPAPGKK